MNLHSAIAITCGLLAGLLVEAYEDRKRRVGAEFGRLMMRLR